MDYLAKATELATELETLAKQFAQQAVPGQPIDRESELYKSIQGKMEEIKKTMMSYHEDALTDFKSKAAELQAKAVAQEQALQAERAAAAQAAELRQATLAQLQGEAPHDPEQASTLRFAREHTYEPNLIQAHIGKLAARVRQPQPPAR